MSKKNFLYLLLAVLLTLVITSCDCDNAETQAFQVLVDGPPSGSIVDTHPLFTWHENESCTPDKYRILVRNDWTGVINSAWEDPEGTAESHTWTGIMQGGLHAYWQIAASTENNTYHSPYTEERDFYVGPLCSGQALSAPVLYRPIDAGWISHNKQEPFEWHYKGGCLPLSYDYQFATDPGFTDIVDSGTTLDHKQILKKSFPNCSTLFWRVRANDGTSSGPWSDVRHFHWVRDESCYQTHYLSDSGARIFVELFHDLCQTTGYHSTGATLDSSCIQWPDNYVTGNTVRDGSDYRFYDFQVDLGSGPCPSTGLDKKSFNSITFFNLLAPGTYCVSIDRDQTVGDGAGTSSLLGGAWTEPRTSSQVAGITVELGPGVQDVMLKFGWDEYDYPTLYYPIPENINCRVGPDPICEPLKIPMEGEILPIIARDRNTEWKLTSFEGQQCYVYLQSEVIDQTLTEAGNPLTLSADLPFFEPPLPCPTPTPKPREGGTQKACSEYNSASTCPTNRCQWVDGRFAAASYCTDK